VWGEEAGQEVGAVLDAFESVADDGSEVVNAVDGEVAEAAFDVGPHGLGGVEVWAVGGQLHDVREMLETCGSGREGRTFPMIG
jgi:hypothetical protein